MSGHLDTARLALSVFALVARGAGTDPQRMAIDEPQAGRERIDNVLDEPLLDARAAANLLGIPESTVLLYARTGRLTHVRVGRHVRFLRADLAEAVQRMRREGRS